MKNEIGRQNRDVLLAELRKAVCLQMELWDVVNEIEELVDCDFDPLVWIQSTSSVVNSGTELGMTDVEDFLRPSTSIQNGNRDSEALEQFSNDPLTTWKPN